MKLWNFWVSQEQSSTCPSVIALPTVKRGRWWSTLPKKWPASIADNWLMDSSSSTLITAALKYLILLSPMVIPQNLLAS